MCSVRSLCGAGQVATILQQARRGGEACFDVNGVGIWHPRDTSALAAMVDPQFNVGKTPHRLSSDNDSPDAQVPGNVKMYNLAGAATSPYVNAGTIRAIRVYENTPEGTKLRQRFDWELPLSATDHASIQSNTSYTLEQLFAHSSELRHILVKDLRKGAIDPALIRALHARFGDADWYISSKEWHPDWMHALRKAKVRLIMVPQTAARRAIARGAVASSWLTFGGVPSQESLVAMGKLGDEFRGSNIIVQPNDETILAFERDASGEPYGFIIPTDALRQTMPFTPMASVFFPAVVAQIATAQPGKRRTFYSIVRDGVSFTQQWQADEGQRLARDDWTPGPAQILVLRDTSEEKASAKQSFRWREASEQWDVAFRDLGIVTVPDPTKPGEMKEEFQLWRGMTELGRYIACDPRKRLALSHVVRHAEELKRTPVGEQRHKSFLFVDSPGSGKSFMVECLRQHLHLDSKHYNITRLQNRNELFNCFQEIAAARSDSVGPVLVFFDEVNARVDSQHIYDSFLEPLEDGKYVRAGSVGRIEPCLWIFAGTEYPSSSGGSTKGEDFEQRLSHAPFHFREKGDSEESEIAKVERVYVGVACLVERFPEVKRVSKRVLHAFRTMANKVPREVRRLVWDFEEVQYSRVMAHNLPQEWHRKYGVSSITPAEGGGDDENLLVEIETRPSD